MHKNRSCKHPLYVISRVYVTAILCKKVDLGFVFRSLNYCNVFAIVLVCQWNFGSGFLNMYTDGGYKCSSFLGVSYQWNCSSPFWSQSIWRWKYPLPFNLEKVKMTLHFLWLSNSFLLMILSFWTCDPSFTQNGHQIRAKLSVVNGYVIEITTHNNWNCSWISTAKSAKLWVI